MKKHLRFAVLILFIGSCFTSGVFAAGTDAKPKAEKAPAMSPEQQKEMELWMKLATPGKYHKLLEKDTGKWDLTTKSWMAPGAEPETTTGSVEFKMILGGRFQVGEYKGTMMGQPYEGLGINGYDNYKEQFVSLWMDTMGTTVFETKGKCDGAECKTITSTGEWDDPMTKSVQKVRTVMNYIDDNTGKFEMYMVGKDGKEFKSMEMVYKRKK